MRAALTKDVTGGVTATRPVTEQDYTTWSVLLADLERIRREIEMAYAAGVPQMDGRKQVCDEVCQQLRQLKATYFPERP